jgi:hypothetical protein
MQDNTLLILGFCGAAIVFMAVGAFLFFWITRSLNRFFIVGLVRRLIGGVDDYTDDNELTAAYLNQRPRPDLRAQAQSLDFDSAVARHRGEPVPPTQPVDASAQSTPTQNTVPTPDTSAPPLRSRRRPRRQPKDDNLDEVFGGMLDNDGDGDVDF